MTTILLIDDDPENRDILRTRLEQAAYNVVEAQNGEEGLSLSASSKPDLIILDVMMPKMDGWQVCRLLKANPVTSPIPIVMLTACSKQVEELRGYESGADDYLMKPCEHGRLLEVVRKWIRGALEQPAPRSESDTQKPETPKPASPPPDLPKPRPGGIWA